MTTDQEAVDAMNEPKGADERAAAGQRAKPVPPGKGGLPQPDWDSGEVLMTPLPPPVGSPQGQMHTWSHNLGSMNLLVDAKLGGLNSQGQIVWSLSTETLFALTDPNTLTFRWSLDEDSWGKYQSWFGITGPPRLRIWIWRW